MGIRSALRPVRRAVSRAALPLMERPSEGFAGEVIARIQRARRLKFASPPLDRWRYPDGQALSFNPTEAFKILSFIRANADRLNRSAALYADQDSRDLLASLFAYRALGPGHVKLPRANPHYLGFFRTAEAMRSGASPFRFPPFEMARYSTDTMTVDCWLGNVIAGSLEKQYWFDRGSARIMPEAGDVVIDAGSCFGDTALHFAEVVGPSGQVHAFEPVPAQCEVMAHNLAANPKLAERVRHHRYAASERSGERLFFGEGAGASSLVGGSIEVQTLSIDDMVKCEGVSVNYIKMDIEGAETAALKGAAETIRRFKPKLGISVYHRLDDLVSLPLLVHEIEPSYRLYLDHHTVHSEETVLYASQ